MHARKELAKSVEVLKRDAGDMVAAFAEDLENVEQFSEEAWRLIKKEKAREWTAELVEIMRSAREERAGKSSIFAQRAKYARLAY